MTPTKALVVFCEAREHPLARYLQPGYQHVFVLLESKGIWVKYDYCLGVPSMTAECSTDYDIQAHYERDGAVVVPTVQRLGVPMWPLVPRNCVGIVKHLLGLRSWALTPYQLYKDLLRAEEPRAMGLLPGQGIFKGKSLPPPPPPPAPPPLPTTANDPSPQARENRAAQRRQQALRAGQAGNIRTSAQGVLDPARTTDTLI